MTQTFFPVSYFIDSRGVGRGRDVRVVCRCLTTLVLKSLSDEILHTIQNKIDLSPFSLNIQIAQGLQSHPLHEEFHGKTLLL